MSLATATTTTCNRSFEGHGQQFLAASGFRNDSGAVIKMVDARLDGAEGIEQGTAVYVGRVPDFDLLRLPIEDAPDIASRWRARTRLAGLAVQSGDTLQIGIPISLTPGVRTGSALRMVADYEIEGSRYRSVNGTTYVITTGECKL